MTWFVPNKYVSSVVNRLEMLTWSVELFWPSTTISGPVQPWSSFLISSNQISGSSMSMTWLGIKKRVKCCQSIRHAYMVCRALSAQCNYQRACATMAKFPYFQQLDIGFKHVYDMVVTQQTRVKCCLSIRHANLVCRALSAQCNHLRPSATMAKFPYFQQLDIGFKHVYDMVWTPQICAKCCQSIRHAYLVCRALSAQCNHLRPSATMAKFPYFQQLDIVFKHVYHMVGTQQTRAKCCQSIRHSYVLCRSLSAQCNHQRPSATMAKFPYFQQLDIGLRHVYDMVGTLQTRVTCCRSIRNAYLVCRTLSAQCNHYQPIATICIPVHPWPSFLISSKQISDLCV